MKRGNQYADRALVEAGTTSQAADQDAVGEATVSRWLPIDDTPAYRWVKLAKHCEATGDTPNAVHARRRKRQWQDGVHCRVGPDGNLYVCPQEYNKWVESQQQNSESRVA